MKLSLPRGRYVVGVSGGVDSMVLLNMLSKLPDVELVVAHFNHGTREDSDLDEKLVTRSAKSYNLPMEIGRAKLGKNASEEKARAARYKFLNSVKGKHKAKAIITAHHQDDLIETAFINILRGTGRKGITALAQNPDVLRPLLDYSKVDILEYAKKHRIKWREDSSNADTSYLRNYIRLKVLPNLTNQQRTKLLTNINKLTSVNKELDKEIATLSQLVVKNQRIDRAKFTNLPPEIATEMLADFLRKENIRQFDKKTLNRLANAIKTAKIGTKHDVVRGRILAIHKDFALLSTGVKS